MTVVLSSPHVVIAGFIPATHGTTHAIAECVAPWVPGTGPRLTELGVRDTWVNSPGSEYKGKRKAHGKQSCLALLARVHGGDPLVYRRYALGFVEERDVTAAGYGDGAHSFVMALHFLHGFGAEEIGILAAQNQRRNLRHEVE